MFERTIREAFPHAVNDSDSDISSIFDVADMDVDEVVKPEAERIVDYPALRYHKRTR